MIELKSKREIQLIQEAGEIIHKVFQAVRPALAEGVTSESLDALAEKIIRENGGEPAFKGYRDFPKTACISINEEVVHGIPDKRKFRSGDIVSFDIGVKWEGFFADAARTWAVGTVSEEKRRLIDTAKESLEVVLRAYQRGWRIGTLHPSSRFGIKLARLTSLPGWPGRLGSNNAM